MIKRIICVEVIGEMELIMFKQYKILTSVAVLAMVSLSGMPNALAQELDRVSQGIVDQTPSRVTLKPRNDLSVSTDETELLSGLKGVVIVNSPSDVASVGSGAGGVEVRGDFAPSQVVGAANNYVGQAVSLASLDRMTRDMVLAFRSAGFPVVNVVVPPQDITGGIVQVIAVVGRFEELKVSGNTDNPDYYAEGFPLQSGEIVNQNKVIDHLRWKGRRFHRQVSAIYEPGSDFGKTNIELDAEDSRPWTVFTGIDNTGTGTTGDFRIFGGFTVGDLLAVDHELSYQLSTSEEGFDSLQAHVASYTFPIFGRTDFQIAGALIQSSSNLVAGASDGTNYQVSGNFITQLPSFNNISTDLRYGFEYKNADNTFAFGGAPVSGNTTEVAQFYGQLVGFHTTAKTSTQFDAGLWLSPGGLFSNNTDSAFNGTRAGAESSYAYVRAGIDHTYFLPKDWRLNFDVQGQFTGNRLITSEQIFIGGFNSVRGFEENALRGDNGILASIQLETPSIELFSRASDSFKDGIRGITFFDYGAVSVHGTEVAGDDTGHLASLGVGFAYQAGRHFTAEGSFGVPVSDSGSVGSDDGQFNFRLIARF